LFLFTVACGHEENRDGIAAAVGNATLATLARRLVSSSVSPLLVIFAAAFGAAAASFLPRPADRLAVAFGAPPRAACAVCARPFPAGPAGWVRAGAACPCRPGAVPTTLAGATIAAVLAARLGPSPQLPVLLAAAVPGLLLALIDRRCLRLPDCLVAALAITAGVPLAVLDPERLGPALVAAVAVLTAYGILACLPGGGLGLGDVKLAAVLGLILGFAGWPAVIGGVVTPHLINGPIALFLLVTRRAGGRRALPFGPALLAGALIALTAA
jgi:leader peptidase (prepilin peptidase) / N-methyltransferase